MRRVITRYDIDAAIERWCKALALAGAVRSVSGHLVMVAEYGTVLRSSRKTPEPPNGALHAAERAVALCTSSERLLLIERYWHDPVWRYVSRETAGGTVEEVAMRCYQPYKSIAAKLRRSEGAIRVAVHKARRKVLEVLKTC